MPGGSKREAWDRVIAALISEPTQAEAAAKAGVSERSIRRWHKLPSFQARLRAARATLWEATVNQLLSLNPEATAALKRNCQCGEAGAEIRAAVATLQLTMRAREQQDLADEVKQLRQEMEATRHGASGTQAASREGSRKRRGAG
jgi:hypothetical protein